MKIKWSGNGTLWRAELFLENGLSKELTWSTELLRYERGFSATLFEVPEKTATQKMLTTIIKTIFNAERIHSFDLEAIV